MAFIKEKSEFRGERKRFPNKYVRLDEGKPVIVQILEDEAADYYKFFLRDSAGRGVSYTSPGYNECPIRRRNLSVGENSPQYLKAQHKHAVNVWDITPMVRCSECQEPHRPDSITTGDNLCSNCSASLLDIAATPYNEIRILERGPKLFGQLAGLAGDEDKNIPPQVLGANGKPVEITQYPITIIRSGTGLGNTSYSVIPHPGHPETVSAAELINTEQVYVLPDKGLDLTSEEVLSILDDSVLLSDIFRARNAVETVGSEVASNEGDDSSEEDVLY